MILLKNIPHFKQFQRIICKNVGVKGVINMQVQLKGQVFAISKESFTPADSTRTIDMYKVLLMDEDTNIDTQALQPFYISADNVLKSGLDLETKPDEYKGKSVILSGIRTANWDKNNKTWFQKIRITSMKLADPVVK